MSHIRRMFYCGCDKTKTKKTKKNIVSFFSLYVWSHIGVSTRSSCWPSSEMCCSLAAEQTISTDAVPCVEQLAHINRTHGVGGGSMAGAVIRRWFPSRLFSSDRLVLCFFSFNSLHCRRSLLVAAAAAAWIAALCCVGELNLCGEIAAAAAAAQQHLIFFKKTSVRS